MRNKFIWLVLGVACSPPAFGAAYDDDVQDFFVTGQSVNAALASANQVICYMKAMRPDALVNDGAYKATIYENKCGTSGANATSEEASATATSSQSSTTASSSSSDSKSQTSTTSILNVTKASQTAPQIVKVWVDNKAQDAYDISTKTYVYGEQTAGPSTSAPYGEFTLNWSSHAEEGLDLFGTFDDMGFADDMPVNEGYIEAAGNRLRFKELGMQSEGNIAAVFQDNGDVTGTYGEFAGFVDNNYQWHDVMAFYKYKMDKSEKIYCRTYLSALEFTFAGGGGGAEMGFDSGAPVAGETPGGEIYWIEDENGLSTTMCSDQNGDGTVDESTECCTDLDYNGMCDNTQTTDVPVDPPDFDPLTDDEVSHFTEPERTAVDLTLYPESGITTDEECYSTDRANAIRNVWRYGVYNTDGTRLNLDDPGFPIRATVTDTSTTPSREFEVHAWADYWGTWIDPVFRSFTDANTEWVRDCWGSSCDDSITYKLTPVGTRIQKRDKSYLSLHDLSGLTIGLWTGDQMWSTQYTALLGSGYNDYEEYQGSYDKDTDTFTFDTGVSFSFGFSETTLDTPLSFTRQQWIDTMVEVWDVGTENQSTFVRNLGVWSRDTNQWYDASGEALANPTLSTAAKGVRTETESWISPSASELTGEGLNCISECISAAKVQATFTAAMASLDAQGNYTGDGSAIASPYLDVGPYIKETTELTTSSSTYGRGQVAANFYSGALLNDGFELNSTTAAITDFVNGDANLPNYMAIYGNINDGIFSGQVEGNGFSQANLKKMSIGNHSDPGRAPALTLDLKSIPAAGSQGTTDVTVYLYDGDDTDRATGERVMTTKATLDWESDGTLVTVHTQPTTSVQVDLITGSGVAISGEYGNTNADSMSYAGGEVNTQGINFKLLCLMTGCPGPDHQFYPTDGHSSGTSSSGHGHGGGGHGHGGHGSGANPSGHGHGAGHGGHGGVGIGGHNDGVPPSGGSHAHGHGHGGASPADATWDPGIDSSCDLCPLDLPNYFSLGTYTVKIVFSDLLFAAPGGGSSFSTIEATFEVVADSMNTFTSNYTEGMHFDGIVASEVVRYTTSGVDLLDSAGSVIEIGATEAAQLAKLTDPQMSLQQLQYTKPQGWSESLAWGIRTGTLVTDSDLAELECRKDATDSYETHPSYTGSQATEMRYCQEKLFGVNNISTSYQIVVETQPSYELTQADGTVVTFGQPKSLYYVVPDEAAYGADRGKRLHLDYQGFGELHGIPGYVYDTATGQELGQFVNNWQPTYRYISRFNLPDGSILEDGSDSSVTYKTKALNGEEWLSEAPSYVGTMTYAGSRKSLVKNRKMKNLGPDGPDYIGAEPTTLLGSSASDTTGAPSVVHEEVIYDPTP